MQERIIFQAKPSLAPIVFLWVVSNAVFLILAFVVLVILGNNIFSALFFGIFMLVVILSTVRLLADLIAREFTKYTLTNERVIKEAGILRRVVNEIPTDAIQGVNLQSPLFGQLLDYGSLIIPSAGMVVRFWDLPHAQQWKQTIQELSKERLLAGAPSRLAPRMNI